MADDYVKIVQRFVEDAFNDGKLGIIDQLYADTFVTHEPGTPEAERTPDDVKQFVAAYRSAFSDGHSTLDDAIVQDDRVAYRWTYRGTHDGDLLGIAPTRREVQLWGVTFLRFENGKVAEQWNGWDMLGLMQQLGVSPEPARV
jgi:steroid delta-isomerase-like uncharacterized protein